MHKIKEGTLPWSFHSVQILVCSPMPQDLQVVWKMLAMSLLEVVVDTKHDLMHSEEERRKRKEVRPRKFKFI